MITSEPRRVPTRHEFDALLRTCSRTAPTGLRNRALLRFLWSTGPRISEALALMAEDLDVDGGTAIVWTAKRRATSRSALSVRGIDDLHETRVGIIARLTGRSQDDVASRMQRRLVAFGDATAEAIRSWRSARLRLLGLAHTGPLFCAIRTGSTGGRGRVQSGDTLSTEAIREWLKRACRKADIPKLSPHAFRHGFATRMLTEGMPPHEIQHSLGHSSLTTTLSYIHDLQPLRLERARTLDNGICTTNSAPW